MKQYMKAVAVQATSILLAALAAAAITFFQSLMNSMSAGAIPPASPEEAGIIGALLKGSHSVVIASRGIIKI